MSDRELWAAKLAMLVQPDRPAEATKALQTVVAMLDADMPARCFTSKSALDAVASCKRRTIVPALADIRTALLQWLRDQDRAKVEGDWRNEDEHWMNYYRKRHMEGFSPVGDRQNGIEANLLDLIREQSPRAYRRITGQEARQPHVPYSHLTAEQRDQLERVIGRLSTPLGGKQAETV